MGLFDLFKKKPEEIPGVTVSKFECVREGLTIRGTEYRPEGENLPVAIVSHGFMLTQNMVRQYTRALACLGYAAYCYDFCGGSAFGRGTSDGATTDMSVLTEVRDLEAVIAYARSRSYTSDELLLMGCSQGGFVSGLTAVKAELGVSKLVLFYPALCIPDDARAGKMLFAKFDPKDPPAVINCGPMKLGRSYVTDVVDMDPFAQISPYTGPVLIVHGTSDKIVNVEYSRKAVAAYEATAAGRTELCIIPDGAHGFKGAHDEKAIAVLTEFARR